MDEHCTLWYRDPLIWEEPEKFLPSRFLGADGESRANNFLPFQVLEILIAVLMEPSSEREEAVCGRGAWQGACLPHSRLCPQVGGVTWFSGRLLYPAVVFFLILLSRTFTPTLVSGNAWEKGVHGFTLCPPDYTVSLAPCQLSCDS